MGFEIKYDKDAFMKFTESVLKKHGIVADAKDVCDFIMEYITEEVKKMRTGNQNVVTFGLDDGKMEQAICKAPVYLADWKKAKKKEVNAKYKENAKKKAETKPEETKRQPLRAPLRAPKKKEEEDDVFDITQLELF